MLGVQSIEKNEWRLWLTIKIYVTGKRARLLAHRVIFRFEQKF